MYFWKKSDCLCCSLNLIKKPAKSLGQFLKTNFAFETFQIFVYFWKKICFKENLVIKRLIQSPKLDYGIVENVMKQLILKVYQNNSFLKHIYTKKNMVLMLKNTILKDQKFMTWNTSSIILLNILEMNIFIWLNLDVYMIQNI